MIDHTRIGMADVGQSAGYEVALGPVGIRRVMKKPENKGTDGIGYSVCYSRARVYSILNARERPRKTGEVLAPAPTLKAEVTHIRGLA
jgi:hypothetical protein